MLSYLCKWNECTILKSNYRNSNPQYDVLLHSSKSQVRRVSIMLLQRGRHVKWLHSLGESKLLYSFHIMAWTVYYWEFFKLCWTEGERDNQESLLSKKRNAMFIQPWSIYPIRCKFFLYSLMYDNHVESLITLGYL